MQTQEINYASDEGPIPWIKTRKCQGVNGKKREQIIFEYLLCVRHSGTAQCCAQLRDVGLILLIIQTRGWLLRGIV